MFRISLTRLALLSCFIVLSACDGDDDDDNGGTCEEKTTVYDIIRFQCSSGGLKATCTAYDNGDAGGREVYWHGDTSCLNLGYSVKNEELSSSSIPIYRSPTGSGEPGSSSYFANPSLFESQTSTNTDSDATFDSTAINLLTRNWSGACVSVYPDGTHRNEILTFTEGLISGEGEFTKSVQYFSNDTCTTPTASHGAAIIYSEGEYLFQETRTTTSGFAVRNLKFTVQSLEFDGYVNGGTPYTDNDIMGLDPQNESLAYMGVAPTREGDLRKNEIYDIRPFYAD